MGRTGSGKSSLTLSLLRLIPTDGEVWYDGQATSRMNLEDLRGAITIIPQQPELLVSVRARLTARSSQVLTMPLGFFPVVGYNPPKPGSLQQRRRRYTKRRPSLGRALQSSEEPPRRGAHHPRLCRRKCWQQFLTRTEADPCACSSASPPQSGSYPRRSHCFLGPRS